MKRNILLLLLALVLSLSAQAIKITHGPWISDMDARSVTITWITDKPGLSWVELAPNDDQHFYAKEQPKYYHTLHGRRVVTDTIHSVRIETLSPDTRYNYRIFTKELLGWSWSNYTTYGRVASSVVYKQKPYSFKTYPEDKRDMTFLVLNDIHERGADLKELCEAANVGQVDFVVLNGDMSNLIDSVGNILDGYLDSCVNTFATSIPLYMNRGNHETRGKLADELYRYFPTPTGKYYQLKTIAGVDYLFIDSGEDKPDSDIEYSEIAEFDAYREEQARWLQDLRKQGRIGKRPLIVFSHIPPFASSWHGPQHLRKTIVPELNQMNVSLMLSGHTHRNSLEPANTLMNFPNLVNSNVSYLLCRVKGNKVEIERAEAKGKNKAHFTFDLK